MAFYAVDVRDRVIQRVTHKYDQADNKRYFSIEAGFRETGMGKGQTPPRMLSGAPNVMAAAMVIVAFVKNAQLQNDSRTIGFATGAGS